MKKISVIVPIYNMEKRLETCLNSLERQTLKDIEVILINDGSQDNSLQIIHKHMEKFPQLYKLIDRENRGISASRNEGIELATGDYIAFVDSDDYVDAFMFEELYKTIIKNDSDIVICNYKKVYDDSKKITYHNITENCKITNLYDNPKMVYKLDYAPWNKLYKKELWENIKYPIGVKYEDLETVLKVFLKAKKITYTNKYLYNYYQNSEGETATIDEKVFAIFTILSNLKEEFLNKPKRLWNAYQELAISKIYIYNQLILNQKNLELSQRFMEKGYKFIEDNFSKWQFLYIIKAKNIKNLILRITHTNKKLYQKYIDKKLEK